MEDDNEINEIFGGNNFGANRFVHTNSHLIDNAPPVHNSTANILQNQSGFNSDRFKKIPFEKKAWQMEINKCIHNKENIFVNVAPSAGKTFPLLKAYAELLSSATSINNIPKIIWVAETKLLASQILNELRQVLYDMILNPKHNIYGCSIPSFMLDPYFNSSGNNHNTVVINNSHNVNIVRQIINNWTGSMMAAGANATPPTSESIAITCSYSFASDLILKYNPRLVVIDEVQERFKVDNVAVDSESDKVYHFFNNVRTVSRLNNSSIAILTGSMNHITAKYIISYLDNRTNSNFKYIDYLSSSPATIAHISSGEKNKSNIIVLPIELSNRDIPNLIIDQIKNKVPNNLITRFSKRGITDIANQVIAATQERNMGVVLGLRNLDSKYTSDFTINPVKPTHVPLHDIVKQSKDEFSNVELFKLYNNMKDPNLKTALAHGFGYIMAEESDIQGKVIRVYDTSDIKVVEEFFKKGLIYSILATTSVGVGVNLKVRHLYINSLSIYSDDGFQELSISSIAQLVHRVGRSPSESAVIYCSKKDLKLVFDIINSKDPSSLVELIPYSDSVSRRISILDRFKSAFKNSLMDTQIYNLITK